MMERIDSILNRTVAGMIAGWPEETRKMFLEALRRDRDKKDPKTWTQLELPLG